MRSDPRATAAITSLPFVVLICDVMLHPTTAVCDKQIEAQETACAGQLQRLVRRWISRSLEGKADRGSLVPDELAACEPLLGFQHLSLVLCKSSEQFKETQIEMFYDESPFVS